MWVKDNNKPLIVIGEDGDTNFRAGDLGTDSEMNSLTVG